MKRDLKKTIGKVKAAQTKLHSFLKNPKWIDEARAYAEKRGKEVRALISSDVEKVKTFIQKEKKQLEKLQRQLPAEVDKVKTFVKGQGKELEKLLVQVRKNGIKDALQTSSKTLKKKVKKPGATKKTKTGHAKPASSS